MNELKLVDLFIKEVHLILLVQTNISAQFQEYRQYLKLAKNKTTNVGFMKR